MSAVTTKVPRHDLCTAMEARVLEMSGSDFPLFAYTPSVASGGWGLTILVEGATEHYPLPERFAFGTQCDMQMIADRLNCDRLQLPADTVTMLITSRED